MKRNYTFTGVILCAILCKVLGYSDGAPERACFRMMPRHTHPFTGRAIGTQPRTMRAPYNITLNRHTWNPQVPISVTIHGGAPFKGFMLMAVEDALVDMPTGRFNPNGATDVKTLYCSFHDDGATHTDNKWKSHITVDWYAPAYTSADSMHFVATVVTNISTIWTNINSAYLQADPHMHEAPEFGEPAEGDLPLSMFAGGSTGLDQWGYPISTPAYGGWGGMPFSSGGFGGGVTPGYTTVGPDTPARSELTSARQEQRTSGSGSRTGTRRGGNRSRPGSSGGSRSAAWGERSTGGQNRGGSAVSRGSTGGGMQGGGRQGEGIRGGGRQGGGMRGGGRQGEGMRGGGKHGEGMQGGGMQGGGRQGEGMRGGARHGQGMRGGGRQGEGLRGGGRQGEGMRGGGRQGEGMRGGGRQGGVGGSAGRWGEGGLGGGGGGWGGQLGPDAMTTRFQQMFMNWLMSGGLSGSNASGTGRTGGGGGGSQLGGFNMFWRK